MQQQKELKLQLNRYLFIYLFILFVTLDRKSPQRFRLQLRGPFTEYNIYKIINITQQHNFTVRLHKERDELHFTHTLLKVCGMSTSYTSSVKYL